MKSIISNYKRLDIFGQEVQLFVKGEQTLRTVGGATMTILMFSILTFALGSFITEMNHGKNANLNTKTEILGDYEGFSFNASDFIFAVGMVDFMGQKIPNENNRIFYVVYYACTKTLNGTVCDEINGSICGDRLNQMSRENNIPSQYTQFTYCMDNKLDQYNGTARLQGSFRSLEFRQLSAVVYTCVNSTQFQGCAPQEEIDFYFQKNTNVYYAYTSHQFNKELDGNPYDLIQGVDITPLYRRVRKFIKIYYQYSQSILDFNPFYFFQSTSKYDGVEYEKTVVDTAVDFTFDNSVAQIEIYLNSNKIVRYVNYQTLMDVAAKLGGFFSILRILFTLLFKPISQAVYYLYLINSLLKTQAKVDQHQQSTKINKIKFLQLFQSREARKLYQQKQIQIKNLLDISEILINPVKLTTQVENLYISIRRSDEGGGGLIVKKSLASDNDQQQQQIVQIDDPVDIKWQSSRSINQECASAKGIVRK